MFKIGDRVIEIVGIDPDSKYDNIDAFIDGDAAIGTIKQVLPDSMYEVEWDWIKAIKTGKLYKQHKDGNFRENILLSLIEAMKLAADRGFPVNENTRGTLR